MKKVLSFLLVFLLLTTVFSGSFVVAATGKTVTLTGEIVKINPGMPYNKDMLALKTSNGNYILNGKLTTQMSKYLNYTASVKGSAYAGPQGISMLNVTSFKIIKKVITTSKPTATSKDAAGASTAPIVTKTPVEPSTNIQLKGTLYNPDSSKIRFLLKTEKGPYELMGNTEGLEKEFGKTIVVTGNYVYTLVATEYPLFSVKSYKVIETSIVTQTPSESPKYIQLTGTLYNTDSSRIRFLLKTEKGPYELMGNTAGLEKEFGNTLLVTGNYVYTLVATEYPLFSVESYKVIETQTATPSPTPIPSSSVKTITIDNNGGYAYINKGDELQLILAGNATTGYSWNYIEKPDPNVLVEASHEYRPENTSADIVGAGGIDVWTYKAVGSGTTALNLAYSRVWESVPAAKTFVIKVIVNELTTPVPSPKFETVKGTLEVSKNPVIYEKIDSGLVPPSYLPDIYTFQLKTEAGPITLNGNTAGLEKYNGYTIVAYGQYSMLTIYPPIFIVESYKIMDPTPTPSAQVVLKGILTVTKSLETDVSGYKFELKTASEVATLQGNTKGLENYNGSLIEVVGIYSPVKIYPPIFLVDYYKVIAPTPTPAPVVLKGTLTVSNSVATDMISFKFDLKTESGSVTLQGNTKGLENYNGSTIEVAGKYSPLDIYPPIFVVESYKVIVPTPVPVSKDHTIISDKALYFTDPKIGSTSTVSTTISGYSTISWSEGTDKAFFKAKIKAFDSLYEFELVAAKPTVSDSIIGLFNIKKNGEIVAKEVSGQLYGLTQPVGSYFKFYSDDMQWHMSAYITNRLDF